MIFLVVSVFFVSYVTIQTQDVISSQLKEVSARVASDVIDLTVLATNSKSETVDMQKRLTIPATVNDRAYSISLSQSNGVWKVVSKLDVQPFISAESSLTWKTDSTILNVMQDTMPVGSPVIVRCLKTTVGGIPSLTIQLMRGG
jgi:hypothetical protein